MIETIISTAIAPTSSWSPLVGGVMVLCNIAAIAIGKFTMSNPGAGPALPNPALFGGMGWPALLATTSFGHILGFLTLRLLFSYGVL